MSIRVAINGAQGRMGLATVQALTASSDFELVGQFAHNDNFAQEIKNSDAQVIVDFTTANVAFENAQTIVNANIHPVIGTSGLTADEISQLKNQCEEQKLGGIIAPNFCIGAVLMMQISGICAEHFPHAEIIELHHDKKADAPSGTAIKTAEMMAANRVDIKLPDCEETMAGARGATSHDIPIHSVRLPGLVAHQSVMFGGVGETLTIRHDTIDRSAFMPGVLLSCKHVLKSNTLVYGLENILFGTE